jgi:hypothetical protein
MSSHLSVQSRSGAQIGRKTRLARCVLVSRLMRHWAPRSRDLGSVEATRDLRYQDPSLRPQQSHASKPTFAGSLLEEAAMFDVDGPQPPLQFRGLVLHIAVTLLIAREHKCRCVDHAPRRPLASSMSWSNRWVSTETDALSAV